RERSLTYQSARRHAIRRAEEKRARREEDSADAMEKGGRATSVDPATVKVTLTDLNPFKPIWSVLTRKNNLCILFPSALLFAFQYSVCFTAARTFAAAPYNYDPLHIGLVLLSFGLGNMFGSVLGGRWSDWKYNKLRVANGGHGWPEMRLRSTIAVMVVLPPSVLAFAWTCQKHTHIAGPVVTLFISGFTVLTLAYVVDANAGRSTAAVASNSSFRGLSGMIASEIAAPLQDSIGD
ncbi:7383_t:CDS:2, partial [Acaulospora colombiana]